MNPFSIVTPADRARLEARDKPYFVRVTDAVHLGYKKGKSVCRWIVRLRKKDGYVSNAIRGAVPDDAVPANGTTVLSYEQALVKAMTVNVENNPAVCAPTLQLLQQTTDRSRDSDRWSGYIHLQRVCQALRRHHRRGRGEGEGRGHVVASARSRTFQL